MPARRRTVKLALCLEGFPAAELAAIAAEGRACRMVGHHPINGPPVCSARQAATWTACPGVRSQAVPATMECSFPDW